MKKHSKKPVKKAKKYNGPTLLDRIPCNQGERLMVMIKFTKRVISNPPLEYEQSFVDQLGRLEAKLEEWKKANPKEKLRNL